MKLIQSLLRSLMIAHGFKPLPRVSHLERLSEPHLVAQQPAARLLLGGWDEREAQLALGPVRTGRGRVVVNTMISLYQV